MQLEVVLSATRAVDTAVRVATTSVTATSVADFTPGPYNVTIPAGQTRATVSIPTMEDTSEEQDEIFFAIIDGSGTDVGGGSVGNATVTIWDNEYTVSFPEVIEIISEGTTERILVRLSRTLREDTTVTFTYEDQTAVSGIDYIPVSSLRIPAGQTDAWLEIPAPDNTIFDTNKLLSITVISSNPPSGVTNDSISIIVRNDEYIELVSSSNITVVAGRALQIKARRFPGPGSEPIVLKVIFDQNEDETYVPDDFAPGPWQIIIPAGQITGSVVIPTIADDDTMTETFNQGHVESPDGEFRATSITVYPVTNLEPSVSIAANTESITEGAGAIFTVTATPAPPENMDVYVRYGQIGGDFLMAEEPDEAVAVTIAANTTTGTLTLTTKADPSNNSGRIDAVLLDRHDTTDGAASYPYTVRGIQSAASIAVMDGTDIPMPRVRLTPLRATAFRAVEEGENLEFGLSVHPVLDSPLTVNLSIAERSRPAPNYAPGGDHVAATSHSVTIPANQRAFSFSIPTVNDETDEPDTIVRVRIESGDGYTVSNIKLWDVTVTDNDLTPDPNTVGDSQILPTLLGQNSGAPTIDAALIAEVKAHIADFTARNHAGGVRDWNLILDRLQGRTGMSDERIAAWLARSRQYGWSDGMTTLPKVQIALAAQAAWTPPADIQPVGVPEEPQPVPVIIPSVQITPGADIEEGEAASFTLTATPSLTEPLSVSVTVTPTGAFGLVAEERIVTLPISGNATLNLATVNDTTDEPDGAVTVTVNAADGYTPGSPSTGVVAIRDNDEPPPQLSITANTSSITEGESAAFTIRADRAADADLPVSLTIAQAPGSDYLLSTDEGAATVTIEQGATTATYRIATQDDATDEADGSVIATLNPATGYQVAPTPNDRATVNVTDNDAPATGAVLSIEDATTKEGGLPVIGFTVRLSAPLAHRVRVRVTTRPTTPLSAEPYKDYHPNTNYVAFKPGQTEKTNYVYVYNDNHNEDPETFEVILSQAEGAAIQDGVAVGTIVNSDPMPAAWLSRFGRAVAEQALDGIQSRLSSANAPGLQGAVAGQPMRSSASRHNPESGSVTTGSVTTGSVTLSAPGQTLPSAVDSVSLFPEDSGHTLTMQDVLRDSHFTMTYDANTNGDQAAIWGRVSQNRFDGREGDFLLDGEATTALLGADTVRNDWRIGLAFSQSSGEGDYTDRNPRNCAGLNAATRIVCNAAIEEGAGHIETSLSALIPYTAYQASERIQVWGAAGAGSGDVTLTTQLKSEYRADTDWKMVSAGLRGDLTPGQDRHPALSFTTDALWSRTTSERTRSLAASQSNVIRLRAGLQSVWRYQRTDGSEWRPRLEAGVRHDGGDAETGLGLEVGGGLDWNDAQRGLRLSLSGRTLMTHEDQDRKDRGISASLVFDPQPDSERGPALALRQQLGGSATNGLDALFADQTLPERNATNNHQRWTMQASWGLPMKDGNWTGSPQIGYGWSQNNREYTLGWRLTPAKATATHSTDWSFGLTMKRMEKPDTPEHRVGFEVRMTW